MRELVWQSLAREPALPQRRNLNEPALQQILNDILKDALFQIYVNIEDFEDVARGAFARKLAIIECGAKLVMLEYERKNSKFSWISASGIFFLLPAF